jgi:hypothetical protein
VRLGAIEVTISDRPTALPPVGPGGAARVHIAADAVRVFAREPASTLANVNDNGRG